MLSNEELAEARRVTEEATSGEWLVGDHNRYAEGTSVYSTDTNRWVFIARDHDGNDQANAAYAAHFDPPFVKRLLDEIERLIGDKEDAETQTGYAVSTVTLLVEKAGVKSIGEVIDRIEELEAEVRQERERLTTLSKEHFR